MKTPSRALAAGPAVSRGGSGRAAPADPAPGGRAPEASAGGSKRSVRPARPAPAAAAPFGLKPPPAHPPRKLASTADLRVLQRMMMGALVRPLTKEDGLQPQWPDGRPTAEVAAEFIKPNDRLSSFERLQIYNRMYWFRLLDNLRDDSPGLQALLGERRFDRLAQAYLARYPSRSFTLRDLASRLEGFIRERPELTAPRTGLALEVARFEWAQTVAFDGEARPPIDPGVIAALPPGRVRISLQPYVTLLALEHPVDDYVIAVKKRDALRGEASNAVEAMPPAARRRRRVPAPRRRPIHIAVHRHENRLYYKRLEPAAFRILTALAAGRSLAAALEAAGPEASPEKIRSWFTSWMALGWLCPRPSKPAFARK